MNYLIIDTALDVAVYALKVDEQVYIKKSLPGERHSESALRFVDELLTSANLKLSDIDVFGVNIGPGSFTGVRIGLSLLKGFLAGRDAKVVAFNSLEALGYDKYGTVCLRASKDDYFVGDAKGDAVDNVRVLTNEEVASLKDAFEESEVDALNELAVTQQKYNKGELVSIDTLSPIYLKLSQAERQLKGATDES